MPKKSGVIDRLLTYFEKRNAPLKGGASQMLSRRPHPLSLSKGEGGQTFGCLSTFVLTHQVLNIESADEVSDTTKAK
jgi:hypothetical protein